MLSCTTLLDCAMQDNDFSSGMQAAFPWKQESENLSNCRSIAGNMSSVFPRKQEDIAIAMHR